MAKVTLNPDFKDLKFNNDEYIIYERNGQHILRLKKNKSSANLSDLPDSTLSPVITIHKKDPLKSDHKSSAKSIKDKRDHLNNKSAE